VSDETPRTSSISLGVRGGVATGLGSLPGTDVAEAQRIVLGELPDLPHLPELPARGPGAEMIGRGAALLAELPIEVYAGRWRLAARAGRDLRVARDYLERDLDTLTEQAFQYSGPVKIQAAGPWTLAASLDLPVGGAALRDPGAVGDLTASLAEGLRDHVAQVRARLPLATILLQLDEPSLPSVLAGRVPTESGLGTFPPVEAATARGVLAEITEAVRAPVIVHCCAPQAPLTLFRQAGVAGVAIDVTPTSSWGAGDASGLDELGEIIDAGLLVFAGAVDTRSPIDRVPDAEAVTARVRGLWRQLGFPDHQLPSQVVVTPVCGLAGASPSLARAALTVCRTAASQLASG
jgi:methionine synthase II (cobalamin-independent)